MSAPAKHSLDSLIQSTIRSDVRAMRAYAVQPSDGLVKLDAMENPFGLPDALRAQLGKRLAEVAMNRYPGPRIEDLRAALASYVDLQPSQALLLGNGSDEIISMLAIACDKPGATILAPTPGFVMYEMSAQLQGLKFVGVPLTDSFELDPNAMLAAIQAHQPVIVYLAYPNNPTANLFDDAAMQRVIDAAPGLVVIDEAYQPFASRSWLARMRGHPQVLVMRTLSKFGLAGIRLGYLIGERALVQEIDKVRPPYNVGVLHCEAALFALEHANAYAEQAAVIRAERNTLQNHLSAMTDVHVFQSEANMILVRVPDARRAWEGMKARGVLVKNVSGMHGLLGNCLRLTVGTPEENRQMVAALKASLA